MSDVLGPEELEARLNAIGDERYHDKHPFHKLLHGGKATKGQVQAWVLNRYCYQSAIPRNDAALISKMMDSARTSNNTQCRTRDAQFYRPKNIRIE